MGKFKSITNGFESFPPPPSPPRRDELVCILPPLHSAGYSHLAG